MVKQKQTIKKEKKIKPFIKSRWMYVLHPTNDKKLVRWRYEIEFLDLDVEVKPRLEIKALK